MSMPNGAVAFCALCDDWVYDADHYIHGKQQPPATATQVAGDHYRKLKIQPVEYIIANDIGFLAGNIIKYASRYKAKGGAEDIKKIMHYCELILEFEYEAN